MRSKLKILFLTALLGAMSLQAGLVDAISIIVDDEPITLYEIYKAQKQLGLSKKKAVEYLIKQKLKEEELKRLGIQVDEFDVNQEIEKIAQKNGIDSLKLREIMAKRGMDWNAYKKQMKEKLLQEKLYKRILSTKIQPPSDETLQEYYRLHLSRFSIPEEIQAIQYSAPDRRSLAEAIKNPMAAIPGVTREAKRIRSSQLNRQLLFLLTQTPKGKFTQVIPVNGQYVTFYIQDFVNPHPIPYEQAKQQVYMQWMEEKRQEAIKSHFEKLRATANVKVLRAP
ncbi:peptidylprolyl isomerase [Hydrogenimonas urashimensis]|uniref:peptidylprolyl isomerase n=1 Tax=Hydrogenimonas urashimensis TaxID=2740515 RepID=UPI001915CA6B|nr:peptidylprolyl isomerase [Hydrogenimonas urashimensis]